MPTVPIADLVQDLTLYPRRRIDDYHVSDMVRALEAGVTLPPVVADRATKRVVDGFHRLAARARAYGETATVEVTYETFANDADLFARALALNANHGKRLDRGDQVRSVLIGERLGMPVEKIAYQLNISEARVEVLKARVILVQGQEEPAKRIVGHLIGQEVTVEQAATVRSSPGLPLVQLLGMIGNVIRDDLFDRDDQRVLVALHRLADQIKDKVPPPRTAPTP